jgi:hypothetical protein
MSLEASESNNKVTRKQTGRLCSNESPSNSQVLQERNIFDEVEKSWRIIGFHDLRELLQPLHPYFKDKKGWIVGYKRYLPEDRIKGYLYPIIKGKKSPYRKHQLCESHTARRINMVVNIIEKYKLNDFKLSFLTLTMPEEISKWLSCKKYGKEIAWRMFQRFWNWYDEYRGQELAGSINLHTWKTEKPLEPHYHFHCLIPNYRRIEELFKTDEGENTYSLQKEIWGKNKKGTSVALTDEQLREVKKQWKNILIRMSDKNKIDWNTEKEIDVHIEFCTWDKAIGKRVLMHWFNYQGRYSLEDYTKYSNKYPDCPVPPEWLDNYGNRARAFGWWRDMKVMAGRMSKEIIKRDILTGKPMKYMGQLSLWTILSNEIPGYLDMVKGNPVYHKLKGNEIYWLASVDIKATVDKDGIINLARPSYG